MGVWVSELELVKTFCSICILGENYEKSRNQIRRNRLWKKTLEVIRIGDNSLHQRQQFSTTEIGISKLINWLNPNDVVGLEAGSQSFRIAKSILNKGIQVIVLNPGDLATIYQSLKKTDKEDSLKIARLIQRFPIEELPVVPIPTTRPLGSVVLSFQRDLSNDGTYDEQFRY
ncbi:transposase [Leptospira noguchii serovar Autumnalis str. ZUN142]|uniref:Transposase n=1 Tax=Leptospira noguchii serovar Autumnalis str. ZUN142 TaxID=1085540 RepID=M6UCV8_9LEPT|nr:transposase [Leptospira noguchii serovar Autumnalis str. ZUN142]